MILVQTVNNFVRIFEDIKGKGPDEKMFTCKDNRTLPAYLRCDFKFDCLHGDDEDNCHSE